MPQTKFAVLRADISREMDDLRRLVAEAEEWRPLRGDLMNICAFGIFSATSTVLI